MVKIEQLFYEFKNSHYALITLIILRIIFNDHFYEWKYINSAQSKSMQNIRIPYRLEISLICCIINEKERKARNSERIKIKIKTKYFQCQK